MTQTQVPRRASRPTGPALVLLGSLALSGCSSFSAPMFGLGPSSIPGSRGVPGTEPRSSAAAVGQGKEFYRAGDYGKANAAFQEAVALSPNDGEAWLGLAASYDRLRRFDLADKAYQNVAQLVGASAVYYNNLGYSFLLRGDLATARNNFVKALELEPGNEVATHNLEMLRSSVKTASR